MAWRQVLGAGARVAMAASARPQVVTRGGRRAAAAAGWTRQFGSASRCSSGGADSPLRFDPDGNYKTPSEAVDNILYNIPVKASGSERHVLSVLVEDAPGVLSRISGLLSGRGHNINTLSVCGTEVKGLSRMTITFDCDHTSADKALRQIEGVEEVYAVLTHHRADTVEREVLLLKMDTSAPEPAGDAVSMLRSQHEKRCALQDLAELFEAKIVDIGSQHATILLTSWSSRIDAFIKLARPYGIIEAARSGVVAMPRSLVQTPHDLVEDIKDEVLDLKALPPS